MGGYLRPQYGENTGEIRVRCKNRIVKNRTTSDGLSTTTYTYAYEGRFNKVTVTTTAKDGKTSSYTDYYDGKGNNMYSSTNVTFVFDDMGNWYEKRNPTSVISTRVLTYFSGKNRGGTSNVTPNNPNTPPPNTPSTPSNTDCVSGDCYNGWGKKISVMATMKDSGRMASVRDMVCFNGRALENTLVLGEWRAARLWLLFG